MVEIYNLGIPSHERFARDQKEVEAFKQQFHLPASARFIDVQTTILDFVPKQPALDLLMQTFLGSSWARFVLPSGYNAQRFFTSHVAPSLGPAEKQDADILRIKGYLNKKTEGRFDEEKEEREQHADEEGHTEEEELCYEGDALIQLLEKGVKETNEMVDFVSARTKQFIQV